MKNRPGLTISISLLSALAIVLASLFIILTIQARANSNAPSFQSADPQKQLQKLAEQYDEISLDDDGMAYINNEIIVMVPRGTDVDTVEALANAYDATIVDSMDDLGIYRWQLDKSKSLRKLERLVKDLRNEDLIEDAYISPVILMEADAQEENDALTPFFPDDPWKGASWNIKAPRDQNWSVEAVRAPQAWAYMDELETVNIGLIDSMVDMNHNDLNVTGAYVSIYNTTTSTWSTREIDNSDLSADDHGTHVAGTMAATWNNIGISGLIGDKGNLYFSTSCNSDDGSFSYMYHTAYTYVKAISVLLDHDVCAINISQNSNRLIGFAASRGNSNALEYLQSQADLAEAMLLRIIQARKAAGKPDFVICVAAGNNNQLTYIPDENAYYGYRSDNSANAESGNALALYNNFLNMIDDAEVAGRIIVVGAVGIDATNSTDKETRYAYSSFSNIGQRVDIAAPGENVYSTVPGGYSSYHGTSMATPHVTAASAMVFAANPDLTGPEVKAIVCASTYGLFNYTDGSCGMLDLSLAIQRAIASRETSVNRVIGTTATNALDLCFVVDTTGSMSDDIDNAKENMVQILESLAEKSDDYRVALVDYRDFPSRTGDYRDYPAMVQLAFTNDHDTIVNAVNGLTLGHGGDTPETVYYGLATALSLQWRTGATKIIIILGDAEPLDPEPNTGYTKESILNALYNADISVNPEDSTLDIGDPDNSLMQVFTINTGSSYDFFDFVSTSTGGSYVSVENASQVADAIQDCIEVIEMEPLQDVSVKFGQEFSGETVDFYLDGDYQFSVALNDVGKVYLEDMQIDKFHWEISRLHREGTVSIREGKENIRANVKDGPWYGFALVVWERHRTEAFLWTEGALLLSIGVLVTIALILRKKQKA